MHDGYEVTPDELHAIAGQVHVSASALAAVHPEDALGAAASACPGGRIAVSALAAGDRWAEAMRTAVAGLSQTATGLRGSAGNYSAGEETSSQHVRAVLG